MQIKDSLKPNETNLLGIGYNEVDPDFSANCMMVDGHFDYSRSSSERMLTLKKWEKINFEI